MTRLLSIFFLILFTSCGGSFDIPIKEVSKDLTAYGIQHQERKVRIETRFGTILCKLYDDTPLHTASFLRLIQKGYYNADAEFYRVKQSFMAQGGNPGRREPNYLIPAEIRKNHFHKRGALASARRDANPGMASNPADFYIVTGEGWDKSSLEALGISPSDLRFTTYIKEGGYPYLDGKYTVFGEVLEGMEVVEKITQLRTTEERPVERVPFEIEAQ